MNIWASGGVVTGIILGLVICVFVFKFVNTNRKVKSEYDERQREIRGEAYRIAFYTLLVYEVIMLVLSIGEIQLPAQPFIVHAAGIFLSCTVLACCCIWNGAYWGLNNNKRRYGIFMAVLLILNVIPVIAAISRGGMLEDGKLSSPFINLMVVIMLLAIIAVDSLRNYLDKRSEEG